MDSNFDSVGSADLETVDSVYLETIDSADFDSVDSAAYLEPVDFVDFAYLNTYRCNHFSKVGG